MLCRPCWWAAGVICDFGETLGFPAGEMLLLCVSLERFWGFQLGRHSGVPHLHPAAAHLEVPAGSLKPLLKRWCSPCVCHVNGSSFQGTLHGGEGRTWVAVRAGKKMDKMGRPFKTQSHWVVAKGWEGEGCTMHTGCVR